ncbi:c-type cytochrome [Bradyrhizobium sp.]|uniref:c-type cytochrome n=1 Tax=Bradyrhizobium sp. TaxID=376 RepID=UPI003C657695
MHKCATIAVALIALGASVGGCRGAGLQDFGEIARGRYLATAADCGSCHTMPGSNQPFAGGRPIETPFGKLVAPNITPDDETGIGAWSDDQFDAAVRGGRARDGARLYPAMPFPYYARMSRDDVKAIRAYLSTVEPVHHAVTSDTLPFPFSLRSAMIAWDALYFKPREFQPDAAKSAEWNRGAYLVQGPAHCGACHTPKTLLGGDKSTEALRGDTLQGWVAPDITSGQGPLGAWTADDLAEYLKAGHNKYAAAAGLMAEVVQLSTSNMSDADVKAIAVYLKDVSGPAAASAGSVDPDVLAAGGAIFGDLCAACHQKDGQGVPRLFPQLSNAASVAAADPTTVLRVILQGAPTVATEREPTGPAMPAFDWQLNDEQVAALASYVRSHFAHAAGVSTEQARQARADLAERAN